MQNKQKKKLLIKETPFFKKYFPKGSADKKVDSAAQNSL